MNTTALAEVAAVAVSSGQSPPPAQPSAAQVAHFEQQLQAPAQFYQAAFDEHDDNVSATFDQRAGGNGPSRAVELHVHDLSMAVHMSNTMLSINLVASAEHLAEENVRTLFQQAG
jgi:hypothetical protein